METKVMHTPGPWEYSQFKTAQCSGYEIEKHDDDGRCMLTVTLYNGVPGGDEANARLIAAAPELYDLAQEYRSLLTAHIQADGENEESDNATMFMKVIDRVDGVLRKAEGKA